MLTRCAAPQVMNVGGLTRQNVGSHLQKYRLRQKQLDSGGAGEHDAAAAAAGRSGVEAEQDGGGSENGTPPPPDNFFD